MQIGTIRNSNAKRQLLLDRKKEKEKEKILSQSFLKNL